MKQRYMASIGAIGLVSVLLLSGCSSDKKEEPEVTQQSMEWDLLNDDEKIKNKGMINPGEELKIEEEPFDDSALLTNVEVESALGFLEILVNDLALSSYQSQQVFSTLGLTPDQIIYEGAGNEETVKVLAEALPMDYIYVGDASLSEQLIAYAYLLKISSLFETRLPPAEIVVKPEVAEVVSPTEILFLSGDGGFSTYYMDDPNLMGLVSLLQTPFTLIMSEKYVSTEETPWGIDKWGVSVKDLAKTALEVEEIPEELVNEFLKEDSHHTT